MNFKEVEKVAREKFNGSCKVCKVCNGIACAGEVPGMGGKGSGSSFIDNRKSLEKINYSLDGEVIIKNFFFLVLCLKIYIAKRLPILPPMKDKKNKHFSLILNFFLLANFLST